MPGVDMPVEEALLAKAAAQKKPGEGVQVADFGDSEQTARLSLATTLALQRIHLLLGGEGIQLQISADTPQKTQEPENVPGDRAQLTPEIPEGQAG